MLNDLHIDANWRSDDRNSGRHVLDQFVAALAPLPRFIRKGHDPDVDSIEFMGLCVFEPSVYFGWDSKLDSSRTNQDRSHAKHSVYFSERRLDQLEIGRCLRRT